MKVVEKVMEMEVMPQILVHIFTLFIFQHLSNLFTQDVSPNACQKHEYKTISINNRKQ